MRKKLTAFSIVLAMVFGGYVFFSPAARSGQQFTAVSAREAVALIQKHTGNPDFVILDIRTPGEYQAGHIENAIMVDYYSKSYAHELSRLDKSKTYLVHCRSGNRSARSMALFEKLQFQQIYHLYTGINGWKSEGLPLVR